MEALPARPTSFGIIDWEMGPTMATAMVFCAAYPEHSTNRREASIRMRERDALHALLEQGCFEAAMLQARAMMGIEA